MLHSGVIYKIVRDIYDVYDLCIILLLSAAGMHIKMLQPSCDESRRLVDWLDIGVRTTHKSVS